MTRDDAELEHNSDLHATVPRISPAVRRNDERRYPALPKDTTVSRAHSTSSVARRVERTPTKPGQIHLCGLYVGVMAICTSLIRLE